MKQVTKWLLCVFCMSILPASAETIDALRNSRQCLVVTTDSWSATMGTMSIFERGSVLSPWRQRRSEIPVVIGKSGLAWGLGLANLNVPPGPTKKEGDSKAPAGIFRLGQVFGYAPKSNIKMPYLSLSPNIVGVDDAQSRFYNRLIDKSKIEHRDWRTAEEMFRKDALYKWGVVVEHNVLPRPGAGSCIFLHMWRAPNVPTVGCTAMSERNIVDLIHWLDPTRKPLLVQLPRSVYDDLRVKWNLP